MLKKVNEHTIVAIICALLSTGMLVMKKHIIVDAENSAINEICSMVLFFCGYYMILHLSKRLKEKKIYGLEKIAWSGYMLYLVLIIFEKTSNIVWNILGLFCILSYFTTLFIGTAELWRSVIQQAGIAMEDKGLNIEALIISAVSFVISIIQILN